MRLKQYIEFDKMDSIEAAVSLQTAKAEIKMTVIRERNCEIGFFLPLATC